MGNGLVCVVGVLGTIFALGLVGGCLCAQEQTSPGAAEPTAEKPLPPLNPISASGTPLNYRTAEDNGTYEPITPHQKLVIATKDTLDYPLFLLGVFTLRAWLKLQINTRISVKA